MIYVTHDQVEAMTMGDRIVVMKDGVIQQVDEPIALYDNPKNMFVAGFIGSPPMNFFRGTIEQRPVGLWFVETVGNEEKGFTIRVHDDMAPKLLGYVGKEVVFGSRPEEINDGVGGSKVSSDHSVTATVEIVEPMGAEVYVHLTTGHHGFVARLDSHEGIQVGQRLKLAFDLRKSHFFDAQTEQVIA